LALVAAACGSSSKKSAGGGTSTTVVAKQGGDLVVAGEQEPQCLDWVGSCASAAWGRYSVESLTMPGAYFFSSDNTFHATSLLTGEATLVTSPKQVVTYHISSKAKWDDGQPITSHDIKYTWDQVAHGKDVFDQSGFKNIESVDDSKPDTAVATFSTPFQDWKSLFGVSTYGILPSHLLEGKARAALMTDGYTFSGGPWKLDHWTKGTEIKLVPNPGYWDKKPNLNSLTFKFLPDTAAEQAAFKSGQVSVLFPQAQPGQEALKSVPNTVFDVGTGLDYEGLWFNVEKPGLNSKAVRQALAYATDRDAIVAQLFGPIQPNIKPIQSWYTPAFGSVYSSGGLPFSVYHLDLNKVTSLMTGDGWAKGGDGIWAKGGQKASFEVKTTTGNKRRLLTAQILQSEWQTAGFGMTITTEKAGVLFGKDLPAGNFTIGLYAQTPSDNDPSECVIWCSDNIPTTANGSNGENYTRLVDPNLDKDWKDVDSNFDQNARVQSAIAGQKVLADLIPALPIDPFPDIIIANSSVVGTETGSFKHDPPYGPFAYANEWFLK
jgi:peptide/nickel transport system substrate-binding protein